MAIAATKPNRTTGVRLTDADRKIVKVLHKKLGVDFSQLVRLGLRALLEKEGFSA